MNWSEFILGLGTASLVWLVLPAFVHSSYQQPPSWLRWILHLPPVGRLLCNALFAGGGAGIVRAVFQSVRGQEYARTAFWYACGWMVGTLIVGGWHLWRGRFPYLK